MVYRIRASANLIVVVIFERFRGRVFVIVGRVFIVVGRVFVVTNARVFARLCVRFVFDLACVFVAFFNRRCGFVAICRSRLRRCFGNL